MLSPSSSFFVPSVCHFYFSVSFRLLCLFSYFELSIFMLCPSFFDILCSLYFPFLFLYLFQCVFFLFSFPTFSIPFLYIFPLYVISFLLSFFVPSVLVSHFYFSLSLLLRVFSHFANSFCSFFIAPLILSPSFCRSLFSLFPIFISLSLSVFFAFSQLFQSL